MRKPEVQWDPGQSLLEFLISLALLLPLLVGAGGLLKAQWDRARCTYHSFEQARQRLASDPSSSILTRVAGWRSGVRLEETEHEIRASAVCGKARESIRLRKLEAMR
jgi:hypothetical protein